jgi:signal transduction histidine kinase
VATPADSDPRATEREQTDDSLRAERERADEALAEQLAASSEAADAMIARARVRADDVLAATRAKNDQKAQRSAPDSVVPTLLKKERQQEDRIIEAERAVADEVVRVERAQHIALLESERGETDKDLLSERALADDAVATRDEFLGVVSHDLRNLLNTMILGARLIDEAVLDDDHVEAVRKNAQRIARAGTRMDRLIGDLLDVSSIDAGALAVVRQPADVAEVVNQAVQTFEAYASANKISLVAEVVPSASVSVFDHARVLQVLVNLLGNAIKFTQAHGKVVVRAERVGEALQISVSDTGAGIPADKLDAIFGRFVQVATEDRRGVGLGLYISKCIVQGHGGRIWAESTLGEGSTFFLTLPDEHAGVSQRPALGV